MSDSQKKMELKVRLNEPLRFVQGFNPASLAFIGLGDEKGALVPDAALLVACYLRFTPEVLDRLNESELSTLVNFATEAHAALRNAAALTPDDKGFDARFKRAEEHLDSIRNHEIPMLHQLVERENHFARNRLHELEKQVRQALEQFRQSQATLESRAVKDLDALRENAEKTEEARRSAESALKGMHEARKEQEALQRKNEAASAELQKKAEAAVAEAGAEFRKEAEFQRQTLANDGVRKQSLHFQVEADKHKAASHWWCGVTVLSAILLVSYVLLGDHLIPVNFPDTSGEWTPEVTYIFARAAAARILAFAALGYALFFCARNYAANRHNAVVNRHRQNALNTYRSLVRANKEPGNADIVLTQAARFIFAPQDSGYGRGGGMEGGDVSVFEPARRAINLAKKAGEEK